MLSCALLSKVDENWSSLAVLKDVDCQCFAFRVRLAEPSDAAPVRKHAAADGGFAASSRMGAAARRNQSGRRRGVEEEVSEKSLEKQSNTQLCAPEAALFGLPESLGWKRMQKTDQAGQLRVY
jgi:hypothetical protein